MSGGILSGGILERGDIVRGDFVLGGYCPGGYCPGDIVRGDIVRGDIVLEPSRVVTVPGVVTVPRRRRPMSTSSVWRRPGGRAGRRGLRRRRGRILPLFLLMRMGRPSRSPPTSHCTPHRRRLRVCRRDASRIDDGASKARRP